MTIENSYAVYAFLVDKNMQVRWTAAGRPTPDDAQNLLTTAELILKADAAAAAEKERKAQEAAKKVAEQDNKK